MMTLPRPQLFLIDGYALIYRAFFAMIGRPLTTSRGENTSAAWGVANFLLRIVEDYRPEYLVWVNDAGTSFRTDTYPEYKATREKLDEELRDTFVRSVERIEQLLAAFRFPCKTVEGYEADDVIGTLASRASQAGLHAVIVSGDKDFYQLVTPQVSLLNPGRGGPAAVQEEVITEENARERLGVPPERVVDYLALVGDSSDNVPGVKGIGDKTARKLIDAYGALDQILAHAAEVGTKRAREALLAEGDNARLSRALVTIQRDVPVDLNLDEFKVRPPDAKALQALFTELEFHSLVDKVGPDQPPPSKAFVLVGSVEDLPAVVAAARRAEVLAVKVFATGPNAMQSEVKGIAFADGNGSAWYLPVGAPGPALDLLTHPAGPALPSVTDAAMQPIVDLLGDERIPKAGHNIKVDMLELRSAGVELRGIAYDAMLASFLLDPGKRSHELDVLALEHLGLHLGTSTTAGTKGKNSRSVTHMPVSEAGGYWSLAAHLVIELRHRFAPQLEETTLGRLLTDIELPLVAVLADMEWKGVAIDTAKLRALANDFKEQLGRLEEAIHEEAAVDFNINSTTQLRHVLFEKLQLPVIKKTKTGPSTDAEVLAQLAGMGFAVPQLLLEYRELSKLVSTYVDALPKSVNPRTGRIHTSFNQTGAATGRLSSSDPNLQNIPVRTERGGSIRQCFLPAPGCRFVVADYSQVELRLLAHLSNDPAFIRAFRRGGDIHIETAAIIFDLAPAAVTSEMRARAKTINFATIYGQGPFALARQLGISQEEAKAFIATYFERFAGVRAFLDQTIERARADGYVETLFGRRRYIPELKDRNYNIRSFGERTAMNSPIQGSAADLIKIAMVHLHRRLRQEHLEAAIVLQVHDELVVEAPGPEIDVVVQILRHEMEHAAELEVPVVVDIGVGDNWLDAKR